MVVRDDVSEHAFDRLLQSASPALHRIYPTLRAAAETDLPTLITGESGTGKELVARCIHQRSKRRNGHFVAVNCGGIPRELIESELFGHRKGAFTGAGSDSLGLFRAADSTTLFLDEIGELPLHAQVKLLRVLQDGKVRPVGDIKEYAFDVRVIAATNRDLTSGVADGSFRLDLFHRLNVLHIEIPPLRERMEDLRSLIEFFRSRVVREGNRAVPSFSVEALEMLSRYTWPGNLRELENVITACAVITASDEIEVCDLPPRIRHESARKELAPVATGGLRELEREVVRETLNRVANNKSKAARILGISRSRLYAMLSEPHAEGGR